MDLWNSDFPSDRFSNIGSKLQFVRSSDQFTIGFGMESPGPDNAQDQSVHGRISWEGLRVETPRQNT